MGLDDSATDIEGGMRGFLPNAGELPSRIGRYTIERLLGRGSFGSVYLAIEDGEISRKVALKVLHTSVNSASVRAALHETQVLAQLEHPSIARVLDGGSTTTGEAFIALEFIDGPTLGEWCRLSSPSFAARLAILEDVAAAIDFAHDRGIIHRDLKPSNILVKGSDGSPRIGVVLDFGIASILTVDDQVSTAPEMSTLSAQFVACRGGTMESMAPEQFLLGASPSARSDLYSLGVLLYWIIAEKPPFVRLSPGEIEAFVNRVRSDPPSPIRSVEPVSGVVMTHAQLRDLNAVLTRALAKNPADRFVTAAEFAGDLVRLRLGQPTNTIPPGLRAPIYRFVLQHKATASAVLAVVLILAVALLLVFGFAVKERAARLAATEALARNTILAEAMRGNLRALVGDFAALGNVPQLLEYWPQILAAYETLDGRDSLSLAQQRTVYAEQLTKAERAGEAIEQLQEVTRVVGLLDAPKFAAKVRLSLGFALEEALRTEEALEVIEGAIANDLPDLDAADVTNHPWFFHALRGRLLSKLGRQVEGIAAIREAIVMQDRAIGGRGSLNDTQMRAVLVGELIRAERIKEALVEGDALLADIERGSTAAKSIGVAAWREKVRTDLLRLRLEQAPEAEAARLALQLREATLQWHRLTGPASDKFDAINRTLEKRGFAPITEADSLETR